jgi:hypothetical protein
MLRQERFSAERVVFVESCGYRIARCQFAESHGIILALQRGEISLANGSRLKLIDSDQPELGVFGLSTQGSARL